MQWSLTCPLSQIKTIYLFPSNISLIMFLVVDILMENVVISVNVYLLEIIKNH